ncbi:universal stress protein [Halorientalis brevis]|uniref:Universal stress protein n=1 Tax=Halorientalis brevis TaxID=1126241 RepID=A0ABD6C618_9EURY|nr:universal stress protein [Halorientalis brevis]
MYEVLLPVDESDERATAQATAITDLPGDADEIHVTIFHSFTDNPSGASVSQLQSARRARDVLEEAGIEYTMDESSGQPATEILDVAEELDADLVCLGGRKRSPAGKVLFGSVTQSVLLDTDRSVLIAHTDEEDED